MHIVIRYWIHAEIQHIKYYYDNNRFGIIQYLSIPGKAKGGHYWKHRLSGGYNEGFIVYALLLLP